jgi:hypothetical protein
MSAHRVVRIEWVDSRQPTRSWQRVSDLGYLSECRCVSVGILLRQDKQATLLALSIADEGDEMQATGVFVIPTAAITSLQTLTASSSAEPASAPKRRRSARGR